MSHIELSNHSQPSLATTLRTVMKVLVIGGKQPCFLSGCQELKDFCKIEDGSLALSKG